jgi:dTDP-D-glucose 4,6-dehydratase
VRQYVHVSEVPHILDLAIQKHLPSGIYNIEGKETLTVKEIVCLIHQTLGIEVPDDCFGSAQRADVDMKYLALDGTKLRVQLGFEASISISDVVSTY